MTETKTITEETVHGSIEYEIVECDSCGQEILPEELNDFTIGDREGVACDMCVDEGPSSFPEEKLPEFDLPMGVLVILFAPLVICVALFDMATEGKGDDQLQFLVSVCVGIVLWSVVAVKVYVGMFAV